MLNHVRTFSDRQQPSAVLRDSQIKYYRMTNNGRDEETLEYPNSSLKSGSKATIKFMESQKTSKVSVQRLGTVCVDAFGLLNIFEELNSTSERGTELQAKVEVDRKNNTDQLLRQSSLLLEDADAQSKLSRSRP